MALTYSQLLDQIDAAITSVIASPNKSYVIAGNAFTKQDLAVLRDWRAEIAPLAAREAQGGRSVRYVVPL